MRISQRVAAILMAGALSLTLSAASFAAKPGRAQNARGAGVVPVALLGQLNLTADQQTRVQAATQAYQAEVRKAQGLSTPKEKRQVLMAARSTYQSALQSILTPEQQQQLRDRMQVAQDFRGLGPVATQLASVNLTEDQKGKIKEIAAKYEPQLQSLRAQQKQSTDKKALRGQMQDLQQKILTDVKAVLTPEQQSQLQSGARRGKRAKNG